MAVKPLGKTLKLFDRLETFKGHHHSASAGSRIAAEADIAEFFGEISKKFDGGSEGHHDSHRNGISLILTTFTRAGQDSLTTTGGVEGL